MTGQNVAVNDFRVVALPTSERTKREVSFGQSAASLVSVMRELAEVEQKTGRTGLPERVCLAFSDALLDAMRLAKAEEN